MEDFQIIIIVQMLKVQMDHQQKSDERQQSMEEQRQQQRNEERLLQALMKSEKRQNQMEELLLKSLNCTKAPVNDITMYSTIETFEYVPENDKTFDAFYRRYEDVWGLQRMAKWKKGNWVQLNTVDSLILSLKKNKNNESGVLRNN